MELSLFDFFEDGRTRNYIQYNTITISKNQQPLMKYKQIIVDDVSLNYSYNIMQSELSKQKLYVVQNGVEFSSQFQSGNLSNVIQKENNTFQISVEADPHSTYKTWFYFSLKGIQQGATVTFVVVNMSNQVKLFKEGHVPVFKNQQQGKWQRIKIPIQQNGVAKGQQGFQLTFKHTFSNKSKHYFAFSYPWTYTECNLFIKELVQKNKERYFCDYRPLCLSTKKNNVNILTITKMAPKSELDVKQFQNIGKFTAYVFPNKKGIFISSRVHPGEVASSHILNGFLKFIFSRSKESQKLLEKCVFYIIPILNPDGVIDGNFRCDSLGHNLNRFYTQPSKQKQPQIYGVKDFVISMIKANLINFCLDLHAHVNKQGSFMYGNSTSSLRDQVQVCLFPKLLQYNCKYFDYQSCNFSEKNMSSKDKGDELSKQGASRVTFFKETGLVSCWTLQCNYNSSRFINEPPKEAQQQINVKPVSNAIILSNNDVAKRQEQTFLNVKEFEQIGRDIGVTIVDYYRWRTVNRYSNSLLKNWTNLHLNLAIKALRMIPFRFDNDCRKILNNINSSQVINDGFSRILDKLGLDPLNQYLSQKQIREKSKDQKNKKVVSQKSIVSKSVSVNYKERKSTQQNKKIQIKTNLIVIPNVPKLPKKR